jgi:hypothetical protein
LAKQIIFDNQLQSNCIKVFVITKKPFWRKDKNGNNFANGDALFGAEYPFNMCHDISPPNLSCGVMVFFTSGKKLDRWEA